MFTQIINPLADGTCTFKDDDRTVIISCSSKIGAIMSRFLSYSIVLDVGRRRAMQNSNTSLTITAFVSETKASVSLKSEYMDPQDFDGTDPYLALQNGNPN